LLFLLSFVDWSTRLTEELLSSTDESSADKVKRLLFARLAPLLALRVIPFHAFSGAASADKESPAAVILPPDKERTPSLVGSSIDFVQGRKRPLVEEIEEKEDKSTEAPPEKELVVQGEKESLLMRLRDQLVARMTGIYEFEEVRKMAAEVSALLPPRIVLPTITQALPHLVENIEPALVKACADSSAVFLPHC